MKDSRKGKKLHIWNNQKIIWLPTVCCLIAFHASESFISLNGIRKRDTGSGRSDPRTISSDPMVHTNFWSFLVQKEGTELPLSPPALRLSLSTQPGKEDFGSLCNSLLSFSSSFYFSSFRCISLALFQA